MECGEAADTVRCMVESRPRAAALRDAKLTQRFGTLFALLVTTFIVNGFSEYAWARATATILQLLMILVAFRTTRSPGRRGLPIVVVVLAVGFAMAVYTVVAHRNATTEHGAAAFFNAALYLVILVAVFRQVIDQQRVNVETILGALCVYFLIGLLFTMLYAGVDAVTVAPLFGHGVSNEDYSYFSFVTLTTVGYGDLVAHTDLGRRIAVVEAMTGQIFLATAVARLVSLYGAEIRRTRRPDGSEDTSVVEESVLEGT